MERLELEYDPWEWNIFEALRQLRDTGEGLFFLEQIADLANSLTDEPRWQWTPLELGHRLNQHMFGWAGCGDKFIEKFKINGRVKYGMRDDVVLVKRIPPYEKKIQSLTDEVNRHRTENADLKAKIKAFTDARDALIAV